MTRAEAESLVAPYIIHVLQYLAVRHSDAKALLGDAGFEQLMADSVRCLGPTVDTIYPWNVADGLQLKEASR